MVYVLVFFRSVEAQTLVTNPPPFLTTNICTGPTSQRLNIVVLGDGYTSNQIALFQTHVTNVVVTSLFNKEPYNAYSSYFNVFSIFATSLQEGSDHPESSAYQDTYFDSTYNSYGIQRLLTIQQPDRVYTLLFEFVPDYNIVIVIVNDAIYGGSGGAFAVTSINNIGPDIIFHELGHSFSGLADEYDEYTPGYSAYERVNCTAQTNRTQIKWATWINEDTPVPTPKTDEYANVAGLFEGCMYTSIGWYRPHFNSFMRSLGRPTGQINSDQIVKTFYQTSPDHIDLFVSFAPTNRIWNIGGVTNLEFMVSPMQPVSHNLAVAWYLDGTNLTSQIESNLVLSSYEIGNGIHSVSNCVSDPTPLVRIYVNDFFPVNPLAKSIFWTLDISNQTATVQASAGPNGSISPEGPVVLRQEDRVNFTIQASNYYHIASILTNGGMAAISNPTNTLFEWNHLMAGGTIHVEFAENMATNNTPEWWLATYYPGTNDFNLAALSDTDGDSIPAWAEYLAKTDPTNLASYFHILCLAHPMNPTIYFLSSSDRYYTLEYQTTLDGGPWSVVSGQSNQLGNGAFFWLVDSNPISPRSYRVKVQKQ